MSNDEAVDCQRDDEDTTSSLTEAETASSTPSPLVSKLSFEQFENATPTSSCGGGRPVTHRGIDMRDLASSLQWTYAEPQPFLLAHATAINNAPEDVKSNASNSWET